MFQITLPEDDKGQTIARVVIVLALQGYNRKKGLTRKNYHKKIEGLFDKYHLKKKLPIKEIVSAIKKTNWVVKVRDRRKKGRY